MRLVLSKAQDQTTPKGFDKNVPTRNAQRYRDVWEERRWAEIQLLRSSGERLRLFR